MRLSRITIAVLVLAAIAAFLLAWGTRPTRSPATATSGEQHETPVTPEATRGDPRERQAFAAGGAAPRETARSSTRGDERARSEAHARREALRARIAHAMANGSSSVSHGPRSAPREGNPADHPGALVDKVGGREAVVAHLNQEFVPLARECIEQALGRAPQLEGMLTLNVESVAHGELGGVIDVAEVPDDSEVREPELRECIRESALTVTLPAPLVTGREKFMLTLRVGMNRERGAQP